MKTFYVSIAVLALVAASSLAYAGVGYYKTMRKIEETCHKALAFEKPTETAKLVCWSHGFYK